MVADGRGHEFMLLRTREGWKIRQTQVDRWGQRTRWYEWTHRNPNPIESWKKVDYDPHRRPWYVGALAKQAVAQAHFDSIIHWTQSYRFFTTKDPGITVSVTFEAADKQDHVIGFDHPAR